MDANNIIDLNKVREKNLLHYWCDSDGDINMPGCPAGSADASNLPNIPRCIYSDYWSEGRGADEYVATLNGKDGLLIGWPFDYHWLRRIGVMTDENQYTVKKVLHDAVTEAGVKILAEWGCPILVDIGVKPEGDELFMFIESRELYDANSKLRVLAAKTNKTDIAEIGRKLTAFVEAMMKANRPQLYNWRRFDLITDNQEQIDELNRILDQHKLTRHELAVITQSLRLRPEFYCLLVQRP